jgi:hypothetical protein
MAYLYRHIRLDKNEVFYIGIGKKQSAERIELRAAKLRKKVLNTCTGEVFFSITELAHKIGKSPMQTTRRIKSGNYNLKFI